MHVNNHLAIRRFITKSAFHKQTIKYAITSMSWKSSTVRLIYATTLCIYRVSQKSGTLNFCYFDIRKNSIFWFHQIKHCLLKRMIQRSVDLVWEYWFYNHFLKHSHLQILLNLRELFTAGLAVHNLSLCFIWTDLMGFRATMYGSQKSHYPWLKCHQNEEKILK